MIQMLLELEEVEQVAASGEAKTEGTNPAERGSRSDKRHMNRGSLPAHLPRVEMVVDIEDHACRAVATRWAGLSRFVDEGRIEIDFNVAERAIRLIALNRKNALVAASDGGGEHWAVVAR
jgi:hypothetical protein